MAISIDLAHHHNPHHPSNISSTYSTPGLPGMPLNPLHTNLKIRDLSPPLPPYYNEKNSHPHIHHQHLHSHQDAQPLRHKPSKKLNMKRSFSVNILKNTNSVEYHPLTDNSVHDTDHYDNNDTETMEIDEYDSDEISCSSCLSTPSKSNFSFLFDINAPHSIPMAKQPSYTNSSILSSLTGSNFSLSIASPPSFASKLYIPTSASTVSCSPITTTSMSPSSVDSKRGRRSLCRSPSSDSLHVILKKSTPSPSPLGHNNNSTSSSHMKSMYSNLTSSLKSFRNKITSYNRESIISMMTESPRLTDDRLPLVPETEEEEDEEEIEEEHEHVDDDDDEATSMEELTTFKSSGSHTANNSYKVGLSRVKFKAREQRSNREFLRLYAFDHQARTESLTLPNCISPDEVKRILKLNPHMKKFHYKYNIHRISNLSRDKLWSNVILPPRDDDSPGLFIDGEKYVYVDGEEQTSYSIVRKQGVYLPWVLKQSIRPAGVLPKSKCIFNSEAPNSGVTNCQFTVKGWCNPRWVDISEE
ncbi:hypothetical protein Cantr_06469 [Candida viswanathii]|uniref:Uncharacterized protein n=1 Tax=Candida viswanathii TaxID=5486 RepID=A0A367XV78_9ASCO|nr:hypothetical protein Cantr_06469 [Candida viswanathii]